MTPGHGDLVLAVAGLGLTLKCDDRALVARLRERYRRFTAPAGGQMYVRVHLDRGGPESAPPMPVAVFRAGILCLDAPGFEARIDPRAGQAHLALTSATPDEGLDYFLRAACALLAFQAGGFLFHAAGILKAGRVYLFFGPSGSGKTTVARLSPKESVLNDDLVVLLPQGDRWVVHATPFSRTAQPPPVGADRGLLKALFHLVKDRQVYVEPLSRGHAVAQVVANVPLLPLDPGRGRALLPRVASLVSTVPVHGLHFTPEPSFWQAVDSVAGERSEG